MLKSKFNDELFSLYKDELKLRVFSERNIGLYHHTLDQFQSSLGDNPPSSVMAKSYLSQWSNRKPATLYKYASVIKGFMKWYGEELDLNIKLPHDLPEYVEDGDVQKLIAAIKSKKTHKKSIERDVLLVQLAYKSGLRRSELANLKVGDIHIEEKFLIVREGKGGKDRVVPLPSSAIALIQNYVIDKRSEDKVFNIKPVTISYLISRMAKSAQVNIHAHSLRHGYATRLLEKGASIKEIQALLGHSNIGTTEVYLSLLPSHLRKAVDLLDQKEENEAVIESPFRQPLEKPQTEEKPYEETHHKQKMRELAGSLQREVGLPHVLDLFVGSSTFVAAVSIDQEENHLYQGLRRHLESGGFVKVLEQIEDWKVYAKQYLGKCHDLFEMVKGKIPETEIKISRDEEEPKPGLILDDFCGTVCADAVGRATGSPIQLKYKTERHFLNNELWVLKYGGYGIYLTLNTEELMKCQKMHENLIVECVSDPITLKMANLKELLTIIGLQISRHLQKFSDMEQIPGQCDLE